MSGHSLPLDRAPRIIAHDTYIRVHVSLFQVKQTVFGWSSRGFLGNSASIFVWSSCVVLSRWDSCSVNILSHLEMSKFSKSHPLSLGDSFANLAGISTGSWCICHLVFSWATQGHMTEDRNGEDVFFLITVSQLLSAVSRLYSFVKINHKVVASLRFLHCNLFRCNLIKKVIIWGNWIFSGNWDQCGCPDLLLSVLPS